MQLLSYVIILYKRFTIFSILFLLLFIYTIARNEQFSTYKIINKFGDTLEKFISWICKKFDIAEEDNLVRDFQKETNTFIDLEKQIKHEEREKEWGLER